MEISPIPGIRLATLTKTAPAVIGLQPVFDIANYAHISDESYTPSQEEPEGGMADDFYDSGTGEEEAEPQPEVKASDEDDGEHSLSFFA